MTPCAYCWKTILSKTGIILSLKKGYGSNQLFTSHFLLPLQRTLPSLRTTYIMHDNHCWPFLVDSVHDEVLLFSFNVSTPWWCVCIIFFQVELILQALEYERGELLHTFRQTQFHFTLEFMYSPNAFSWFQLFCIFLFYFLDFIHLISSLVLHTISWLKLFISSFL